MLGIEEFMIVYLLGVAVLIAIGYGLYRANLLKQALCVFFSVLVFGGVAIATGHAEPWQPYEDYVFLGRPYARVMQVASVDGNIVEFVDGVGFSFMWEQDPDEAWAEGETAAVLMDDVGTESIRDDVVVYPYYSCYQLGKEER